MVRRLRSRVTTELPEIPIRIEETDIPIQIVTKDKNITNEETDSAEEHLYENLDDLKRLISDAEEDSSYESESNEYHSDSNLTDPLLAEFSDYGEISEDDE